MMKTGLVGIALSALLMFGGPASAEPASRIATRPTSPIKNPLVTYHQQKIPAFQRQAAEQVVADLMPHLTPSQRTQAIEEVLGYQHIVWHTTALHHLDRNIRLVKQFEPHIREVANRYGVPADMAIGILTWENSGSTGAVSYSACVGMGQMSEGAMHVAHEHSHKLAVETRKLALRTDALASASKRIFPPSHPMIGTLRKIAAEQRRQADLLDLTARHEKARKKAGLADERMMAGANIEDSIAFMRVLLINYGGRADLAISAYHNGLGNNDDLFRDLIKRTAPAYLGFTPRHREPLLNAIKRFNLSYMSLWSDRRIREILSGLRTVGGAWTTPANAYDALGDESDIYVWKVAGALLAYRMTPSQQLEMLARYRPSWDEVETAGFRASEPLVAVHPKSQVKGVPELLGYLYSVQQRYTLRTGKALKVLPHVAHDGAAHSNGLAFDFSQDTAPPTLRAILNEDWLFDRINLERRKDGSLHVCINPRYGHEFRDHYDRRKAAESRRARQVSVR